MNCYICGGPIEVDAEEMILAPPLDERAPLDEREREILKLRLGLDGSRSHTVEELAAHFNLTCERIRYIESCAMSKVRHSACSSILLALTEMRDTPKRELLHKIIVAISRGVDD